MGAGGLSPPHFNHCFYHVKFHGATTVWLVVLKMIVPMTIRTDMEIFQYNKLCQLQ